LVLIHAVLVSINPFASSVFDRQGDIRQAHDPYIIEATPTGQARRGEWCGTSSSRARPV
jgi:hypothetical protein